MRPQKPCIEISKYNVNHWKMLIRFCLISSDRHSDMFVTEFMQVVIARPSVGSHFSVLVDMGHNKWLQRFLSPIGNNLKA